MSKFCPLITAASVLRSGKGDEAIDQCEEEKCAWWIADVNMCAVRDLALELQHTQHRLQDVTKELTLHRPPGTAGL